MLLLKDCRLLSEQDRLIRIACPFLSRPGYLLLSSHIHLMHNFIIILLEIRNHDCFPIFLPLKRCRKMLRVRVVLLRLVQGPLVLGESGLVSVLRKCLDICVSVRGMLQLVQVTVIGLELTSGWRLLILASVQALVMVRLVRPELSDCLGVLKAQLLLLSHVVQLDLVVRGIVVLNQALEVVLGASMGLLSYSGRRSLLRRLHRLKLLIQLQPVALGERVIRLEGREEA